MATQAQPDYSNAPAGQASTLQAFIDHWIYVFMAVMLIAVVLIGFIPDSMQKIAAVEAGQRPPFPIAMHVHAVLMGSWMLLLLAQTSLMATGRKAGHMQFGVLGMVLAPALVIAGVVLVPINIQAFMAFTADAPVEMQPEIQGRLRFITDIAAVQFRVGICFLILVTVALMARKRDAGLHKRLMILATIVPMPAATDRMQFLYNTMPDSPITAELWPLLCIVPMLFWDLYRQRGIHPAYWIFAAVQVPGAIFVNLAWGSEWWHSFAPQFLYGA